MHYRQLGKSDIKVPALGFGCMRLPLIQTKDPHPDFHTRMQAIDEKRAIAMIDQAMERGVTYFDTAYPYHGGKSEELLGKAVRHRRPDIMLATKSPVRLMNCAEDFDRILNEQLVRLDTDYLDFYLLHGLTRSAWEKGLSLGMIDFLKRIQKEGRAKHVGFSFHDDINLFKEIIDSYEWTLCQIQYNYFDEHWQAGKEGLTYAAGKGIGVVIMEPLRGGRLTDKIPADVQKIWDSAETKRSPAEWGLRWVWNHPEVSMVLSGMTAMDQLTENLQIADSAYPNSLTPQEMETIQKAADTYRHLLQVPCTGCGYCLPCPNTVNIPMNFSMYNDACMFDDPEMSRVMYTVMMPREHQAAHCQECHECEDKCPQHIEIVENLKKVHQRLGTR